MYTNKYLYVAVLILIAVYSGLAHCPALGHIGNIYSAQVVASIDGGLIGLQEGEDTQCYNYTFPFAFKAVPDVAIAIHSFEAQPTNNLFFYVKPVKTDSLSSIPILVRTQWPYTQWIQISFNLIAEDRSDIDAGYFQVDSGPLADCADGKAVELVLPFTTRFASGIKIQYAVFLHGFEISTTKSGNSRSPFELQIATSSSSPDGIHLTLSVTTTTKVDSVYISFVAFQNLGVPYILGSYTFDSTIDTINNGLSYVPQTDIPLNYARIYGANGFLINFKNQELTYATNWDGILFSFNVGDINLMKYFSFSFIFFTGSECQDCAGFPIIDNGVCISSCPVGTYLTSSNTCINCGKGRQWNGTNCITSCPAGQFLNTTSGLCECPPTLNWDGQSCIPCIQGKIWSTVTKSCECPKPLIWNGFACAKIEPCVNGKVWDVYSYSCQCPDGTFWNGDRCESLTACTGGQVRDLNNNCVCPSGFVWIQNRCSYSPCSGGQVWTGSKCVCPAGLNFNGSICLECINGQKWDSIKSVCGCESGYEWNGQYCQKSFKCSNGRVWNQLYQQCICADGSYWSGYACLTNQKCTGDQIFDSSIQKCTCLSGFQWDGKKCIECKNGRIWNITTLSCNCPIGTAEIGFGSNLGCKLVQTCTGGKEWSQGDWTCVCPPNSAWNGANCILNPCSPGQKWNDTLNKCICPGGKVLEKDSCVPPKIVCTNGRVWNNDIYACSCPINTFPTATTCDPAPTCPKDKVYNPLNNKCQCPFGLASSGDQCIDPKCPTGQYYNGEQCQVINCPPPSYFLKDRCVYGGSNQCEFGYHWTGKDCVYYPSSCPSGTSWTGLTCQNTNGCGQGFYSSSSGCTPLPQQCLPPSKWDGSRCATGNLCPKGTYTQGDKCLPFQPCNNGFVWDPVYLRCVCPPGTINTGNKCIGCSNDQKWSPSTGCACPDGSFDTGASCQTVNPIKCSVIANSVWGDSNKCTCRPGFTKVGFQCVCYGTQIGNFCDKCSYKPNSVLNPSTDKCECGADFTEIRGYCVKVGSQIDNSLPQNCAVGTFFDTNHKACLACPAGCLSCITCYKCQLCKPEFTYDPRTEQCIEFCGDGKRFTTECDDGNNEDGDGCSRDCKIEAGFNCVGGSPDSKDTCTFSRPESVAITQFGQIRRSTSIVLNLKLNYMPKSLLQATECQNKCSQVLIGTIISGETALSITSEYLAGTNYAFTMTIDFGRTYIAKFKIRVSVAGSVLKYFGGSGVTPLEISVDPTVLASTRVVDSLE